MTLPVTHGATSERHIRPVAANHRRRVLRQLRLRAGDLDSVARGYLDLYCRAQSKVEMLDAYFAEHGLLDAKGEPQGATKIYFVALNSARLNLARLEEHVHMRTRPPGSALAAHLEATYCEEPEE